MDDEEERKRGDFGNGGDDVKKKFSTLAQQTLTHTSWLFAWCDPYAANPVGTRVQIRREWYAKLSQFTTHIQMQCIQSTLTGKVTWIPFAQISSHIRLFKQTRAHPENEYQEWHAKCEHEMSTKTFYILLGQKSIRCFWICVCINTHAVYNTELHWSIVSVLFLSASN